MNHSCNFYCMVDELLMYTCSFLCSSRFPSPGLRYWWSIFRNHIPALVPDDIRSPQATKSNTELCSQSFWLQASQTMIELESIIILGWDLQYSSICKCAARCNTSNKGHCRYVLTHHGSSNGQGKSSCSESIKMIIKQKCSQCKIVIVVEHMPYFLLIIVISWK